MSVHTCRMCGCTDHEACYDEERGACHWHEAELCSHCAETVGVLRAAVEEPIDADEVREDVKVELGLHHAGQLLKIIDWRGGNIAEIRAAVRDLAAKVQSA